MTRPRFRPYPNKGAITIADGKTHPFQVGGNFVNVKQANVPFTLRLDSGIELIASQNRRFSLKDDEFNKVEVVNDSGGNLTFQLEIGFGAIEANDVTISGLIYHAGGANGSYGLVSGGIGSSATLIKAANTSRTGIIVENKGMTNLYIGLTPAVNTSTGITIAPVDTYNTNYQGALYGIRAGSAEAVAYIEETL